MSCPRDMQAFSDGKQSQKDFNIKENMLFQCPDLVLVPWQEAYRKAYQEWAGMLPYCPADNRAEERGTSPWGKLNVTCPSMACLAVLVACGSQRIVQVICWISALLNAP